MKLLTGQELYQFLGKNYKNGYFLLILFNFIIGFLEALHSSDHPFGWYAPKC